jgi:protein-disulfide isomerase
MKSLIAFGLGVFTATLVGAVLWRFVSVPPDRLYTQLLEQPEFLADHPELLSAAQAVLHSRGLAAEGVQRAALMRGKWQYITHAAFTPTAGPADGPLLLLEFTDYTCEPCRVSQPAVREIVDANSDLRLAILLMPTGGALSEYAARVALAAYKQNPARFATLHNRLMELEGPLTQQSILETVSGMQFDVEQIMRDVASSETRRYLSEVRMFAEEMNIPAVPAFVLSEQLLLGRVESTQLGALVESGRATLVSDEKQLTTAMKRAP